MIPTLTILQIFPDVSQIIINGPISFTLVTAILKSTRLLFDKNLQSHFHECLQYNVIPTMISSVPQNICNSGLYNLDNIIHVTLVVIFPVLECLLGL